MSSSINPNNIDGNFPVAGQPNNTQGFRDNFTNIKTNFATAATEITDLETKGIFKSALTGTSLDNNMADNLIYAAAIRDFSAVAVQLTATSGTITVDYSAGHYQAISTTGSISLSFTNFPAAGAAGIIRLSIAITNTAYTLTLPAAVSLGTTGIQGYSANVITFAATGTYQFEFSTVDSGTTITIFDLNRPLRYFTNAVNVAATTASSSTTTGALIVAGGVGVAGNLYIGGTIVGNIAATGNTFAGNTTVGNLLTAGFVSATGNITGGNISAVNLVINNISSDDSSFVNIEDGVNVTGAIVASGNITGGNVLTGGLISATANITGGNVLTGGLISATANITGGNILTGGLISATANITGGNLSGTSIVGTLTTAAQTNITSVGTLDALAVTGNITSGNLSGTSIVGTLTTAAQTNITSVGTLGALAVTGNVLTNQGNVLITGGTGGVGYTAGAGGTVTQGISKATAVTLNKQSGEITMNGALLATATIVSFVLTNSTISANDLLLLQHQSGGTLGAYTLNAACAAGSATIYVRNETAGSLSEAVVLRYAVVKGAVA
jgi:hypothetical protein